MASSEKDSLHSQQVWGSRITVLVRCAACFQCSSNCAALWRPGIQRRRGKDSRPFTVQRGLGSLEDSSLYSLPSGAQSHCPGHILLFFPSVLTLRTEFWDPTFCICGGFKFQLCFLSCNMHMNHLEILLKYRFCFCRCSLRNYLDAVIRSWARCRASHCGGYNERICSFSTPFKMQV